MWRGLRAKGRTARETRFVAGTEHRVQPRSWVFVNSTRACTGGASGSTSSENMGETRWYMGWPAPLAAAAAIPAIGGFTYWVLYSQAPEVLDAPVEVNLNIKQITEETFEVKDNLFVIFLDKSEDLLSRRDDIQRVIRALTSQSSLSGVSFYYNIRKEGDPPVAGADASSSQTDLRVVMYKGQRKSTVIVGSEVPTQTVLDFFTPLSEQLGEAARKMDVPRVCGTTFEADVRSASTPDRPVLVQMYEDTCFLCFLMRPFINSLAEIFAKQDVPLKIKRLNIERNDFPVGCPVARGTPTFVIFRGPESTGEKWDEFKPKELVEKITKDFPKETATLFDQMDELQGLVSRRFQLFTQLVMWTVELQKLERLTAAAASSPSKDDAPSEGADETATANKAVDSKDAPDPEPHEDDSFNAAVSEMMTSDMKRVDNIIDNLAYLQKEVDEVEHDAVLMGTLLAENVRRRELVEEELFASVRV